MDDLTWEIVQTITRGQYDEFRAIADEVHIVAPEVRMGVAE